MYVEDPNQYLNEWSFSDLMCALFAQFVNVANVDIAICEFKAVSYSKMKGVQAFANELIAIGN